MKSFSLFSTSGLSHSRGHVAPEAFAVEPGLAAVYVAHIEEVFVGLVFRAAVAADHEHVVLRRERHGDAVVQRGRRGVGAPVHGVDADGGASDDLQRP